MEKHAECFPFGVCFNHRLFFCIFFFALILAEIVGRGQTVQTHKQRQERYRAVRERERERERECVCVRVLFFVPLFTRALARAHA